MSGKRQQNKAAKQTIAGDDGEHNAHVEKASKPNGKAHAEGARQKEARLMETETDFEPIESIKGGRKNAKDGEHDASVEKSSESKGKEHNGGVTKQTKTSAKDKGDNVKPENDEVKEDETESVEPAKGKGKGKNVKKGENGERNKSDENHAKLDGKENANAAKVKEHAKATMEN